VPATGKESLIVALDVPTVKEALATVDALGDTVSFFKIGLQLFLTGELPRLLEALRQKDVFVDLKVPGDISNTISSVIDLCVSMEVRFLTLSESMPNSTVTVARDARNSRGSGNPKLLTVPFISSLDRDDLKKIHGVDNLDDFIVNRARAALEAGCDGVIASGPEIRLCRNAFPKAIIVSPGIRPTGTKSNDHKRFTTPRAAILMGSDYLVVGRPILTSESPELMAKEIINEIELALGEKNRANSAGTAPNSPYSSYSAAAAASAI
jgi:orotidine-5'-phosphate decarboxylase